MIETAITETWTKPLTCDERLLIDLLLQRYEGVDELFVKFEDEHTVTLKIPKIRRNFAADESQHSAS